MKKLSVQDVDRCVDEKQNSDSREMQKTAPSHSSVVSTKDISLTVAEIKERRLRIGRHPTMHPDALYSVYAGDMDSLLSIIDTLQPSGWQDIESCPRNGRNFLAASAASSVFFAHWANGVVDSSDWGDDTGYVGRHATHWMPLPPNPVTQDTGGLPSQHVPDHGQASNSKPSSKSESAPDVQAADVDLLVDARDTIKKLLLTQAGSSCSPGYIYELYAKGHEINLAREVLTRLRAALAASPVQPEVPKALEELREMFPSPEEYIYIKQRHWFPEYSGRISAVAIVRIHNDISKQTLGEGATLSEAMAKVREWKEQDNAKS